MDVPVSSDPPTPSLSSELTQRAELLRESEQIRDMVPRLLPSVARLEALPQAAERRLESFGEGRVGCVVVVLRDQPHSAQEQLAHELTAMCRRSDLLFALGFDTLVLVAAGATPQQTAGFHARLSAALAERAGLRVGQATRTADAREPFDLRAIAHAAYRNAVAPPPTR
jgi:hypothetical protein